ncbi:hypothetical protein ACSHT0_12465 [Tepidicaulis sp. LMO-SS28]|uniref:hypothetical protein n=1 Tax=Tepidicaulis sp. LMO-SS28 TaxID=3447455 RepID=UPI003EE2BF5E
MPQDPQKDPQVQAAARTLLAQYGEDAETVAMLRAAEFAAAGDGDAVAKWDHIIAVIQLLLAAGEPGENGGSAPLN